MQSDSNSAVESDTVDGSEGNTEEAGAVEAVPLFLVSAYQDQQLRHKDDALPKLPSHRFRFSVWHDVSNIHVTGDKLRAPRVREGPPSKEELFYRLRDSNDKRIHHNLRGRDRFKYQREQENWEDALHVNLAYQELQHDYQGSALIKVLHRLESAEEIVLFDNGLINLGSVYFPRCTHLNLSQNYIGSFNNMPHLPVIRFLNADRNDVSTLKGLEKLQTLEYLTLRENPIAFSIGYRNRVFNILPTLKYLDNIPKMPEDLQAPTPSYGTSGRHVSTNVDAYGDRTCVIS